MSESSRIWLTTEQAAPFFDYDTQKSGGKAAFLQFAQREGVPYYRMSPKRWRWNQLELEEWLNDRRIGGLRR